MACSVDTKCGVTMMPGRNPLRALVTGLLWLVIGHVAWACSPSPQHWQPDIDRLVANDNLHPPPRHAVLFVGSSSIRMWTTLAADFPGVPAIDRGFGGSTIADSTHYADRIVIPYQPRVIVMYAGDNDIAEGCTPGQVLDEFEAFVARVRRALPDVAVVYISIKPSIARRTIWPRMAEANRLIADWTRTQRRVTFVDVSAKMLDARGNPRPSLFREDGLHMSRSGYAIWTRALTTVLARHGFGTR
ncbi:MAG TPA: SGNH/GDSL hydrolase family protein [Rhodanobacteraceae bacterium]|jgi:lysophospholipase L1-like esterase|nr:SGNH/GDSL hydrolase family protein [Rhodanobacteraceae bacterium]